MFNIFSLLSNTALVGQSNTQGAANLNGLAIGALQVNTQLAGNSANIGQANG